jgi:septal ring factor EnvC (AmiA/AmiB activator)
VFKSFLIFSLLVCGNAFAKKSGVSKLKDQLSRESSEVSKIAAEIKSLESKLGQSNESYLSKTQQIKEIDQKITTLKNNLSSSAQNISKRFKESKRVLNSYLLDAIDENNQDELLKRRMYMKVLASKLSELKTAQISSQKLLVMINEYEENLKATSINEETLYNLILNLERKKESLGQSYISKMEAKNELEERLAEAVARIKVKKKNKPSKRLARSNVKLNLIFDSPISNYLSLKGSKEGVTYKYDQVGPIKISQKGQVVYAGELASYGRVVMIDHGKDIRSVILGDINLKVKKGDLLDANGLVGYTNIDLGLTKSLYYEIRKNNKAQNTMKLIKTTKI